MLKAGDKIRMTDVSYSFGVKDGEYNQLLQSERKRLFTVVKTNLLVARKSAVNFEKLGKPSTIADTLITDNNCGFWFVQSKGIKQIPPEHTIIIDGKAVNISDEAYQSLKKAMLE